MPDEHVTNKQLKDFEKRQEKRFVRIEEDISQLSDKVIDHREADVLHKKWRDADARLNDMKLDYTKQIADIKLHLSNEMSALSTSLNEKLNENSKNIAKIAGAAAIIIPLLSFLLDKFAA